MQVQMRIIHGKMIICINLMKIIYERWKFAIHAVTNPSNGDLTFARFTRITKLFCEKVEGKKTG